MYTIYDSCCLLPAAHMVFHFFWVYDCRTIFPFTFPLLLFSICGSMDPFFPPPSTCRCHFSLRFHQQKKHHMLLGCELKISFGLMTDFDADEGVRCSVFGAQSECMGLCIWIVYAFAFSYFIYFLIESSFCYF